MNHPIRHARIGAPIDEATLCAWLGQALPGDVLEYHRGHLAFERDRTMSPLPAPARRALDELAKRALWASEHGLVHLVQKRHGPDDHSYLAITRPRPRTPPTSLAELLTEALR